MLTGVIGHTVLTRQSIQFDSVVGNQKEVAMLSSIGSEILIDGKRVGRCKDDATIEELDGVVRITVPLCYFIGNFKEGFFDILKQKVDIKFREYNSYYIAKNCTIEMISNAMLSSDGKGVFTEDTVFITTDKDCDFKTDIPF